MIPELRKHHVVIDVKSPSPLASLLTRLPWLMLLVLGVAIIAGFARLMRGGKMQSESGTSALPAHGIIGFVSRLFARWEENASPPTNDKGDPNIR